MNKFGQSIIEYILIAVLVIFGIVIMGPYVLRSISAHFKLWDEGVQDSFHETPSQAPVNDVPNMPANCDCVPDTSSGCGSYLPGSQCGVNQSIWNHSCNPQGCDSAPISYCKDDPKCCSEWVNRGCGTVPLPVNASGNVDPSLEINPPEANNCYFGQEIQVQQCGLSTTIKCIPATDPGCSAQCIGTLTSLNNGDVSSKFCDNAQTGINQPVGISYVSAQTCKGTILPNGTCCTGTVSNGVCSTTPTSFCNGTKCQAYCDPSLTENLTPDQQVTLAQHNCIPSYNIYCNSNGGSVSFMTVVFADGTSQQFNKNVNSVGVTPGPASPPLYAFGSNIDSGKFPPTDATWCDNPLNPSSTNHHSYGETATFHDPNGINLPANEWIFRYDDCPPVSGNSVPDYDFNDVQCIFVLGGSSLITKDVLNNCKNSIEAVSDDRLSCLNNYVPCTMVTGSAAGQLAACTGAAGTNLSDLSCTPISAPYWGAQCNTYIFNPHIQKDIGTDPCSGGQSISASCKL